MVFGCVVVVIIALVAPALEVVGLSESAASLVARLALVEAAQEPLEGLPEVGREDGIDDGVEHGVEVAEPEEDGEYERRRPEVEQRHGEGHEEEGQPAHYEDPGDDGQRLGGLPFALRLDALHGQLLGRLLRDQLLAGGPVTVQVGR